MPEFLNTEALCFIVCHQVFVLRIDGGAPVDQIWTLPKSLFGPGSASARLQAVKGEGLLGGDGRLRLEEARDFLARRWEPIDAERNEGHEVWLIRYSAAFDFGMFEIQKNCQG
jgi:hypothetical protein